MKKNKIIILIMITILFMGICGLLLIYTANFKKPDEPTIVTEKKEKLLPIYEDESDSTPTVTNTFTVEGVSDEELEILNMTKDELSDYIEKWTDRTSEYSNVVRVQLLTYEKSETEEMHRFTFKTSVEGQYQAEQEKIIVLDYYNKLDKYCIHP